MTTEQPTTTIDPVCGMTVDVETARTAGLVSQRAGETYAFCGRGCFLEFTDEPDKYLAPDYKPSM